MLSRRHLLAALAGLPWAIPGLARAAPDGSLLRVLDAGVIRIGVQVDGTAAASVSPEGALWGYLPELGRHIASGLGVRAEFVQVPRGEMLDRLQAGQYDLGLGGVIASASTALRVLLSDPILSFRLVAVTPQAVAVQGPADLRGLRVAVIEGRSFIAATRQAGLDQAQIAPVPNWEQAAEGLLHGAYQAAIVPEYHAKEIERVAPRIAPRFALGEFWQFCQLRMGEHDLLRALNVLLYILIQKGELPELHRVFFGRDMNMRRTL